MVAITKKPLGKPGEVTLNLFSTSILNSLDLVCWLVEKYLWNEWMNEQKFPWEICHSEERPPPLGFKNDQKGPLLPGLTCSLRSWFHLEDGAYLGFCHWNSVKPAKIWGEWNCPHGKSRLKQCRSLLWIHKQVSIHGSIKKFRHCNIQAAIVLPMDVATLYCRCVENICLSTHKINTLSMKIGKPSFL